MSEIIFLVEEADEGGYTARAVNEAIFTEGDTLDEIRQNVREAVDCHFDDSKAPQLIRLHIMRKKILTA
jgi:predicted RNase H-like HicB family nuclease